MKEFCKICLQKLPGHDRSILQCSHVFHKDCIEEMRHYSVSDVGDDCPICRSAACIKDSVGWLLEESGKAFLRGRHASSVNMLEQALAKDPQNILANYHLSKRYKHGSGVSKDPAKAKLYAEKALTIFGKAKQSAASPNKVRKKVKRRIRMSKTESKQGAQAEGARSSQLSECRSRSSSRRQRNAKRSSSGERQSLEMRQASTFKSSARPKASTKRSKDPGRLPVEVARSPRGEGRSRSAGRADQAGRQASIWYEDSSDEDAWPCKSTQALAMAASHAPAEPSSTAVPSVGASTSDSPPKHTALSGTEMASRLHKLLQDVQNSDSEEEISGDIDEEPGEDAAAAGAEAMEKAPHAPGSEWAEAEDRHTNDNRHELLVTEGAPHAPRPSVRPSRRQLRPSGSLGTAKQSAADITAQPSGGQALHAPRPSVRPSQRQPRPSGPSGTHLWPQTEVATQPSGWQEPQEVALEGRSAAEPQAAAEATQQAVDDFEEVLTPLSDPADLDLEKPRQRSFRTPAAGITVVKSPKHSAAIVTMADSSVSQAMAECRSVTIQDVKVHIKPRKGQDTALHAYWSKQAANKLPEHVLEKYFSARYEEIKKELMATEEDKFREWLLGLDRGKGALMQYLPALKREFDADRSQLLSVKVREAGASVLGAIEPSFFESCEIRPLGHRVTLARGICELAEILNPPHGQGSPCCGGSSR